MCAVWQMAAMVACSMKMAMVTKDMIAMVHDMDLQRLEAIHEGSSGNEEHD